MRIAVTGVGMVTPYGPNRQHSWAQTLQGMRAARRIEIPDPRDADSVSSEKPTLWSVARVNSEESSKSDEEDGIEPTSRTLVALARQAAQEAVLAARITQAIDPVRFGCAMGTSKGDFGAFRRFWNSCHEPLASTSEKTSNSIDWQQFLPNACSWEVARCLDLRGPVSCPVAACATGLVSILQGAHLIRGGLCDAIVVGSADTSIQLPLLASFQRMKVLADVREDPASACRPFDRHRTGFVVGEGAGALVLERWEHAQARQAPILAEWVDGLFRSDPADLTRLDASADPLFRLVTDLLHRSDVPSGEIDAVSLHGTGTRLNDLYEAKALARALPYEHGQWTGFAMKGGLGHLLGAAGSVESAISVMALANQIIPPTPNLTEQDPACRIPLTSSQPVSRKMTTLLKISLGFGGHLAAGLFRSVGQ